ncbi:MAG: hypothetical protein FWE35_26015 [Streptosporangiales bacterium]|nr:hypothetical protein [Streptosporangiales bacterium]
MLQPSATSRSTSSSRGDSGGPSAVGGAGRLSAPIRSSRPQAARSRARSASSSSSPAMLSSSSRRSRTSSADSPLGCRGTSAAVSSSRTRRSTSSRTAISPAS